MEMTNISGLIGQYQIEPTEIIPITRRVYKVHSHNYTYALKRSRLSAESLKRWEHVFVQANQHHLSPILSVYLTRTNKPYIVDQQQIYYLSPWKETKNDDKPEHELESFFHVIGEIHHKTRQEKSVNLQQVEQYISHEKKKIDEYRKKLLYHIETFERKRFMSPFELRVCMQYRDIEKAISLLDEWYDYYLEDMKSDEKVSISLCHGNLRRSHQIYQANQTYLINWENTFIGSPIEDLGRYFYQELKYHDAYIDDVNQAFSVYEKYNPLLASERSLLAVYLLYPTRYLKIIEKYKSQAFRISQPFQIKQLEYGYRQLVHGLKIQHHLYQVRQEIKRKEWEAQNDSDD
ncbi:phosphotransferase [Aquibacillus albus]|uniref:Spore coat protein YsxE n=1 Tax=Aquibacillus albus TaxID=1168171 RepID=A0ABS2N1J9_9BACI|nr:phosphotransferase [Aquibacillus albus]MBM7572012.1 spore coat protein YsxE [Aquibacillus albus]